ncbi:cytochrome c oxidase assembly factor CtaG [Radiobacillus sp. PE A8.2]|uniref:cytochrome c oxidase assembly factor CtaG n=1 Tax=Radiobacillus sp. PE A8.2 TaxID=3380349 RepID=UPI00388F1CC6
MWTELQIFGFQALWSPYYLTFVAALGVLYFFVMFRRKSEAKPTIKQWTSFYLGLILLYVIKGSPVDLLSHIMFTSHMAQMALYYLVFPILIIKGIPVWFWLRLFSIPILKSILKLLTTPLIALIVFNGLFSIYHMPTIFDFTKANPLAHAIISTTILITAFCMWWPVFTPVKEMETLSPLMKIGYIFANGVLITPACALIIFSNHSLYATYSETSGWIDALALCVPVSVLNGLSLSGPEMFSPIPIVEDQQLGGVLMKITQEIVYGAILAKVFFEWFNKESKKVDPLPASAEPRETT